MKKKIKDLTNNELDRICDGIYEKYRCCSRHCPLFDEDCDCLKEYFYAYRAIEKIANKEVEIKNNNNN